MPTYKTYSSEKWKDPTWIRNARLKLKEAGVPDAVAAFEADLTDFQEQYMSPIEIRQFEANLKALGLKEVARKAPPEAIEKAKVEVEKIGEEKAKPKPVSVFKLPYSTAEMRERLVTPPVKEAIPEEKQLLEQAVRKEAELPPIREVEKKYPKEVIRELYDLAKGKVIEPSEEEKLTQKIRQVMPVFAPVMEPGLSPEETEVREKALQAKWDAEYQRRLAEANLPTTMLEPLERRLKELGVTPEDYAAIRTPIAQRERVGEMVGPAIQIAAVVALVSLMGYQGIRGVVGQIQYNKALKAMENIDKAYKNLAAGKATAADNALIARWEEVAKNPTFWQLPPKELAKLSGGPTEAEYQAKLTRVLGKKIVPKNILEEGLERSRQYALRPPTTRLPAGIKGRLGNLGILKDVSKYNLMAAKSKMPLIKDIRTLQDAAKVSTFAPPSTPEVTEYVGQLKTIELAKDMITNWPALTGQAAEAVQIPTTIIQAGSEVITVFNSALIVNALSGAPLGQAMQAAMEVVKQVQALPVTPAVTPARAAWKPPPPVHPRDFEEDLPKKELVLQIARSPTESVPYVEVEKQVGAQGFAQMVGTGVLERKGEDVILGENGKRIVSKLQGQEKRLTKFQAREREMYPEPSAVSSQPSAEEIVAPGVVEPVLPEEGVRPETPPPVGLVEQPQIIPKEPWELMKDEAIARREMMQLAAKEPWQMTKIEWVGSQAFRDEKLKLYSRYIPNTAYQKALEKHKTIVSQALAEGKPVPPEVLADYPDLAAKGEPTAVAEPTAKEPWQMTREEFKNRLYAYGLTEDVRDLIYQSRAFRPGWYVAGKFIWGNPTQDHRELYDPTREELMSGKAIPVVEISSVVNRFIDQDKVSPGVYFIVQPQDHKLILQQALSEGKPVPPEVLADYPDLAAVAEPTAPSRPPTAEVTDLWKQNLADEMNSVPTSELLDVAHKLALQHPTLESWMQPHIGDFAEHPGGSGWIRGVKKYKGEERYLIQSVERTEYLPSKERVKLLARSGISAEELPEVWQEAQQAPPAVEGPAAISRLPTAIEEPAVANQWIDFKGMKVLGDNQGVPYQWDLQITNAEHDAQGYLQALRSQGQIEENAKLQEIDGSLYISQEVAEPEAVSREPTAPVVEEPDIPMKIEAWAAQADKAALKMFRATVDELYDAGQSYAEAEAMAYRQMTGEAEPTVVKPEQVPEVVNNLNATNREKFEAVESEMMEAGVASEDAEALALEQVAGVKVDDPRKADRIENGFYKVPEEFERIVPKRGAVDPRNRRIARYIAEDGTRLTQFRNGDWGISGPMMTPFQRFAEPEAYDQVMTEVDRRRARFLAIGKLKQLAEGRVVVDAVGKEFKLGMNKARRWIKQMTGKEVWADVTTGDIEEALQYLPFIGPRFKTRPFADLWYEATQMVKTGELNPDVTKFVMGKDIVVEAYDEFGQPREPTPAEVGQAVMDFLRDQSLDPYPGPPAGRELISPELLKRLEESEPIGAGKLIIPAWREFEKMGIPELPFEAEVANAELVWPLNDALTRWNHLLKDLRKAVGRKAKNTFTRKRQGFDVHEGRVPLQELEAPYVKFHDGLKKLMEEVQEKSDRARAIQGLPPLEKRENYMMHMFDQYVSDMLREKYPFDETLAYLIDTNRIPPSKVFDPTQLRRIGREGGLVTNLERIVPAMFSIKLRYAAFQPFLTKWRPLIEKMPPANRKYANEWLEYSILNRPSDWQRALQTTTSQGTIGKAVGLFANIVAHLGEGGKSAASRIRRDFPGWFTQKLTRLVYGGAMAGNLQVALVNACQQLHQIGINGSAGFMRGLLALRDPEAWRFNFEMNPMLAGRMPMEKFRTGGFGPGKLTRLGMAPYKAADIKNVVSGTCGSFHQLLRDYPEITAKMKAYQKANGGSFYKALHHVLKDASPNDPRIQQLWMRVWHRTGVTDWFYRAYTQSTITRMPLGRVAMIFKTWMQYYGVVFFPEMWHAVRTGKDNLGFKLSPGERTGLWQYLLVMGALLGGTSALGFNFKKIFGPWVFRRQPSPILGLIGNLIDFSLAVVQGDEYKIARTRGELERSWQIFIPFFIGAKRIYEVASGEEPRWWMPLIKPTDRAPKPERIKAYERMTPQEQGNFVYTLSSEENQDLQRLIDEMERAKKEDREMKWTPAERRKAVKLGLKFNKYVDSLEKLKQKDEREAGRTLAEGDEAGARSILWAIGYRDEKLEDKLAELERRWVPQTLWKINRFIGEAIEGLMPEAGPPAISGQPSAVSRQPSAGDGDWLYQNCTPKQLKDEGWVEEQRRKILETHGEEGIEEFDRDLVAALEML